MRKPNSYVLLLLREYSVGFPQQRINCEQGSPAGISYTNEQNTIPISYGHRREKTCLRGFRQSEFQTSLLSYRD